MSSIRVKSAAVCSEIEDEEKENEPRENDSRTGASRLSRHSSVVALTRDATRVRRATGERSSRCSLCDRAICTRHLARVFLARVPPLFTTGRGRGARESISYDYDYDYDYESMSACVRARRWCECSCERAHVFTPCTPPLDLAQATSTLREPSAAHTHATCASNVYTCTIHSHNGLLACTASTPEPPESSVYCRFNLSYDNSRL